MTRTGAIYHVGDCLEVMSRLTNNCVDLVLCSPPYGNQRTYGIGLEFGSDGEWCKWCADRYMECLRICRGLVAWVVEGYTKGGTFHPLPELLTCEIMRRGANIRRRMIYRRMGIMGGSPDELAQHHEIIVCATQRPGRLPWADTAACGHPPKCPPGGHPSHQSRDGRVNRPRATAAGSGSKKARDGEKVVREYKPPTRCKASNVIECGAVGGGHMGHALAHENEAPYPLKLAELIIRSYCPPEGIVLDPFCGSGTTGHAALLHGRRAVLCDIRHNQVEIAKRRIREVRNEIDKGFGFNASRREQGQPS